MGRGKIDSVYYQLYHLFKALVAGLAVKELSPGRVYEKRENTLQPKKFIINILAVGGCKTKEKSPGCSKIQLRRGLSI